MFSSRPALSTFRSVALLAVVSLTFIVGCSGLPSTGNNANDFKKSIYIGGGGGVSRLTPYTDNSDYDLDESQSGSAWGAIGVDLSERLAIEAQFADLGSATVVPRPEFVDDIGSDPQDISYQATGLSAQIYGLTNYSDLSRRVGFAGFARLGISKMSNESDILLEAEDNFQVWFGLGAEYMLSNGLAARAELSSYDGDAQALQLGLVYRIGLNGSDDTPPAAPTAPEVIERPAPEPVPQPAPEPMPAPEPVPELEPVPVPEPAPQPEPVPQPEPDPTIATVGVEGVLNGVEFVGQSDQLTSVAQTLLSRLAPRLQVLSDTRVEIRTYTDTSISSDAAMQLTRKRAISVARFLISRGVPKSQLAARAFGNNRARADNATEGGRRMNNRVELKVLP